jgi:hypothetical protein
MLIQGIHKRMVRLQKLTRNLFLTLHGHNLPEFECKDFHPQMEDVV